MGVMGKRKPAPRALVASVATAMFDDPVWHALTHEEAWQSELWRLYDCVPEFSRGASWVGSACSRVRIYVAEVDDNGEVQKEVPVTNPVGKLAATVLGGPTKRADLLRLAGIDLTVVGEFWLVAFSTADSEDDRWYIVSGSELRRIENAIGTGGIDPYIEAMLQLPVDERPDIFELKINGKPRYLVQGRDIIARVWTQHPYRTWQADSPGRSLSMVLTELEILTQYILAQARSRLASGGVWPWPASTGFPTDDQTPVGAESLMKLLSDAGQTNLKSFGGASQLFPMLVEVPPDVLDKIKEPIVFGSVLSEQAMALRKELRDRLATGMDVQPEIITGMGDTTHWNAPQVEQSTIDSVIKPIMTRICDALTEVYLYPALKRAGKPTKKYRFWFDTASIVTRPNRLKEVMEMYAQKLVGWEEVLKAADLPDSAHMGKEEYQQVLSTQLLLSDGNMILIPELREKAGLDIKSVAPDGQPLGDTAQAVAGRAPAPPPPPRSLNMPAQSEAPTKSTLPNAPNNATPGTQNAEPRSMTASVTDPLVVHGDLLVRQALDKVGKHLARGHGKPESSFDRVYLTASVDGVAHAHALVSSRFGSLGVLGEYMEPVDADAYRSTLIDYTAYLVAEKIPHEVRIMRGHLERKGLL